MTGSGAHRLAFVEVGKADPPDADAGLARRVSGNSARLERRIVGEPETGV
jgi:hypothetical protein